jgi:hypothetical protein
MKIKYIFLILAITLLICSVLIYAYDNPRNTIDYARALFIFKLTHPNMTPEQNLQLARLDFLYKAGVIK